MLVFCFSVAQVREWAPLIPPSLRAACVQLVEQNPGMLPRLQGIADAAASAAAASAAASSSASSAAPSAAASSAGSGSAAAGSGYGYDYGAM